VTAPGRPLADRRILVIEDMLHIAWEMCDELRSAGASIVGPAGQLDRALELATEEQFDAAVLDVALAGEPAGAVAEALRRRGAPFVLVSGYACEDLPEAMAGAPLLNKPVSYPTLIETLARLTSGSD
jgi:CheY-like chemotaxis protein